MKAKLHITIYSLLLMVLFLDTSKGVAMDQPQSPQEQRLIYVKTNDEHLVPVELWKIKKMRSLDIALQHQEHQQNYNNTQNPIYAPIINFDELTILQNALTAVSKGEFSQYFQYQLKHQKPSSGPSAVHQLINAAEKAQANMLSALCLSETAPKENQKEIIKPFIKGAVNFFKNQMIARSAHTNKKFINIHTEKLVACSSDNRTIAVIDINSDRHCLYDIITGRKTCPIKTDYARSISFSPDGTKIALTGVKSDGSYEIRVEEFSTEKLLQTTALNIPGSVSFSPTDNNVLLWYDYDGECLLYNIADGSIIQDFSNLYQNIYKAHFSPDGKTLLILCNNNPHRNLLCHVTTGELISFLPFLNEYIDEASFSSDGKQLILSSQTSCWLFNIENSDEIFIKKLDSEIPGGYTPGRFPKAQFVPHSNSIALTVTAASHRLHEYNTNIIIWNFDTNRITFNAPAGYNRFFEGITLSPDGRWMIVNTYDNDESSGFTVWNLITDEDEQTLALFNNLNAAQARFVYKLCPSETPDFSKKQELYTKLFQLERQKLLYQQPSPPDIDFAIFKTLPKEIQSLFIKELFRPNIPNTPPSMGSDIECIGNECTIL